MNRHRLGKPSLNGGPFDGALLPLFE